MEDRFALQDEYEASRSSVTHASGLVSPTRSTSFSPPEDATTRAGRTSPSFNQSLSAMTGDRTPPHSDSSSFAGSRSSHEHGSGRKHWARLVRSTHKNRGTEGEATKVKKNAAKMNFTMDGLINEHLTRKRARSHSATLPSPIIEGKGKQTTSTSSTDSTLSSRKPIGVSRKTRSLIATPAPSYQISRRPSNIVKLPTGPLLTSHHRLLKMKLTPLVAVESQILHEFSILATDEVETRRPCPLGRLRDHKELIIRPLRGWEEKFGHLRVGTSRWLKEEPKVRGPDDPSNIISAW